MPEFTGRVLGNPDACHAYRHLQLLTSAGWRARARIEEDILLSHLQPGLDGKLLADQDFDHVVVSLAAVRRGKAGLDNGDVLLRVIDKTQVSSQQGFVAQFVAPVA